MKQNNKKKLAYRLKTEKDNHAKIKESLFLIHAKLSAMPIDIKPIFSYLQDIPDSRAIETLMKKVEQRAIHGLDRPNFAIKMLQYVIIAIVAMGGFALISSMLKNQGMSPGQITNIVSSQISPLQSQVNKLIVKNATVGKVLKM